MANLSYEHQYHRFREDDSNVSKKSPGKISASCRARGRPLRNQPPVHLNKGAPLAHMTRESCRPDDSVPSPDHQQPFGNDKRTYPPQYSGYRTHPGHQTYRNPVVSRNPYSPPHYPSHPGYWRLSRASRFHPNTVPESASRQYFEVLLKECKELKMLVDSLGQENENLKDQAKYQLASLQEQLEITKTQNSKLEEQAEELKELKTKLSNLEAEVAGKDMEIDELNTKNKNYQGKADENREQVKKFKGLAAHYEKESCEKQAEIKKVMDELEKQQAEIILGKEELGKKQEENRIGIAYLTKLKREKNRLCDKVQRYKKRLGSYQSFQRTLSQVLDNLDKKDRKIEVLVQNYSMQKIEYNHIIKHFISSYKDVHNEFRLLRDNMQEEDELKKGSIDVPLGKAEFYNRPVDVLLIELQSNFDQLKTLEKTFQELEGNTSPVMCSERSKN